MKEDIVLEFKKRMMELQKQITSDSVSDFIPNSNPTNPRKNTRKYPDGKLMDEKLPKNYKLAKGYKKCLICNDYKNKKCSKFNAVVRSNYVCGNWSQKGIG